MPVDAETIRRAQQGDESAYNAIVLDCRRRVLGPVYRFIGRPEDVEDVAQEVFVRLYFSLRQLREPSVFEAWLYKLTVNAAYDYLRRKRRGGRQVRMADLSEEQAALADAAESGRRDADEAYRREIRDLLETLFDRVRAEDRILLTLKEVEGRTVRELSEIYGVNENAMKVRLFRARRRMLAAYDKMEKDRDGSSVGAATGHAAGAES